jgi:hypothetical protein
VFYQLASQQAWDHLVESSSGSAKPKLVQLSALRSALLALAEEKAWDVALADITVRVLSQGDLCALQGLTFRLLRVRMRAHQAVLNPDTFAAAVPGLEPAVPLGKDVVLSWPTFYGVMLSLLKS